MGGLLQVRGLPSQRWTGLVCTALQGYVSKHEATCGEALVECACGESFYRKAIDEHKRKDCPMQPISCDLCDKGGIYRCCLKEHYAECKGAVPMSVVSKLISRIDLLENELQTVKRQKIQ